MCVLKFCSLPLVSIYVKASPTGGKLVDTVFLARLFVFVALIEFFDSQAIFLSMHSIFREGRKNGPVLLVLVIVESSICFVSIFERL